MKVLFDTNVILDAIIDRNDNHKYARRLIDFVIDGKIVGYVSSKQITDIYYVLRKYCNELQRRKILYTIIDTFKILPLLSSYISYCMTSQISDYEDAIINETARVNMISTIVTNNTKDFINSELAILTPKELYSFANVLNQ